MKHKIAKSIVSLLLMMTIAVSLFGSVHAALMGDVNFDGKVSAADARLTLRAAVGLQNLSAAALAAADMNEDDQITAADARMVLRKAVGLPLNGGQITEDDLPADAKILYLTFDDGPSARTIEILDILDEYDVKATFFVVNGYSYNYLYAEEVRRGHSIGLHSDTHEFDEIYSSTSAFFDDLETISDRVYEYTGVRTYLMRFAGGSSNTISANYSYGIMTKLTRMVEDRGYVYFDWNGANNDATGETLTATQMYYAAMESMGEDRIVMLMHDASYKYTTVQALPSIIEAYLDAGYYLIGLNENSFTAHHTVNN